MDRSKPAVTALRLRHPDFFHVDVTLTEKDGRWLAVAMLADEPAIGTKTDPREALQDTVGRPGEPVGSELAADLAR
jgi:hypothetical protein